MKNEVIASLLHGEENSVKTEKKVIQPLPVAEDTTLHYLFSHHLFTVKNASFDASLKYLFINNNVYLKKALNKRFLYEVNGIEAVLTVNVSKWLTWYKCHYVEENSGEIIEIIKESESLKKARARAINCLNTFDEFYGEAYRQRLVTCLFITLTNVPNARHSIRSFMMQYKKALARSGVKLLGYVWVSEVSYKGNIDGGHWHYHLVISVERLHVRGGKLPEVLDLPDKIITPLYQRLSSRLYEELMGEYYDWYVNKKEESVDLDPLNILDEWLAFMLSYWTTYSGTKMYGIENTTKNEITRILNGSIRYGQENNLSLNEVNSLAIKNLQEGKINNARSLLIAQTGMVSLLHRTTHHKD